MGMDQAPVMAQVTVGVMELVQVGADPDHIEGALDMDLVLLYLLVLDLVMVDLVTVDLVTGQDMVVVMVGGMGEECSNSSRLVVEEDSCEAEEGVFRYVQLFSY